MKLFVGNLPEGIDATRIKTIFAPFTSISECDIVKNYAFITLPDDDVELIKTRMDGYMIDGKAIQIKNSTSKLKPIPGMSNNQCLRCCSTQHRTPQCPQDPNNQGTQTIKIDLTQGTKRPAESCGPEVKRMVVADEEIPQPDEPELQQLFGEYTLARQRYKYYRERLIMEIEAKRGVGQAFQPTLASTSSLSSAPITYQSKPLESYTLPTTTGSHPYANLKAPYAPATPPNAPYAALSTTLNPNNAMTAQQYMQQALAQGKDVAQNPAVSMLYGSANAAGSSPHQYGSSPSTNAYWMQQNSSGSGSGLVKLNMP